MFETNNYQASLQEVLQTTQDEAIRLNESLEDIIYATHQTTNTLRTNVAFARDENYFCVNRTETRMISNLLDLEIAQTLTMNYILMNPEARLPQTLIDMLKKKPEELNENEKEHTRALRNYLIAGLSNTKSLKPDTIKITAVNITKRAANTIKLLKTLPEEEESIWYNGFNNYPVIIKRRKDIEMKLQQHRFDENYVISIKGSEGDLQIICYTNTWNWLKHRQLVSSIAEVDSEKFENKDDLKEILRGYGDTTQNTTLFAENIKKILNNNDISERLKQTVFKNLLKQIAQNEKNKANRDIINIKEKIREYEEYLERSYRNLETYEKNNLFAESKTQKVEESLNLFWEFITKCKEIKNTRISNNEIKLYIDSPIVYFDEVFAKKFEEKLKDTKTNDTLSFNFNNNGYLVNGFLELFHKIFITQELTMLTSTEIKIKFDSETISWGAGYVSTENRTYLGQPHLTEYNCFGNNKTQILKAFKEYDFVTVLGIMLTSTKNFNLTDSAVFSRFLNNLRAQDYDKPSFLEETTGKLYSFKDIVLEVKKKKEEQILEAV